MEDSRQLEVIKQARKFRQTKRAIKSIGILTIAGALIGGALWIWKNFKK